MRAVAEYVQLSRFNVALEVTTWNCYCTQNGKFSSPIDEFYTDIFRLVIVPLLPAQVPKSFNKRQAVIVQQCAIGMAQQDHWGRKLPGPGSKQRVVLQVGTGSAADN